MKQIGDHSDAADDERAAQAGLAINTHSPPFALPDDIADAVEAGDYEEFCTRVANWWDDLNADERADVMNLDEVDGTTMVENLLFIDLYNEDIDSYEPVWE